MPTIERIRFWGKENRIGSKRPGVALGVGIQAVLKEPRKLGTLQRDGGPLKRTSTMLFITLRIDSPPPPEPDPNVVEVELVESKMAGTMNPLDPRIYLRP